MGSAVGISARSRYAADPVTSFRVKQVFSHSSSGWRTVRVARFPEPAPGPAARRPALGIFLHSAESADLVMRDTDGDGWYDSVEIPRDSSSTANASGLPMLAFDSVGDGRADTIIMDTSGGGQYNCVVHRSKAPLSFLATLSKLSADGAAPEEAKHAGLWKPGASNAALAPGWEQKMSSTHECPYYVHHRRKLTTWDRAEAELPPWPPTPTTPSAPLEPGKTPDSADPPIGPGWKQRTSTTSGRPYFFHAATGHRTWDPHEAALPRDDPMYPAYWKSSGRAGDFVELVHTSSVFRHVQMLLASTFLCIRTRDRKTRMPEALEALKVWRVENATVWRNYQAHRAHLREVAATSGSAGLAGCDPPPRTSELTRGGLGGTVLRGAQDTPEAQVDTAVNEVYLFHGTSPQGALGIVDAGFDMTKAVNSACYGPGVYFSECSSKSDEYSSEEAEGLHRGHCAMLLCRVLLGRVLLWQREFSPELAAAWATGNHDSILGDRARLRGTYREFVLPTKCCNGAYPEYLVLYRRRYEEVPG